MYRLHYDGNGDSVTSQGPIFSTAPPVVAPRQVQSQSLVTNLNADIVDVQHASSFVSKSGDSMTGLLSIGVTNGVPVISAVNKGTGVCVVSEAQPKGLGILISVLYARKDNY